MISLQYKPTLKLHSLCDQLSKTNKSYILTSDFNLKHDWCLIMLEHVRKSYNPKKIVNEPTRHDSLLDLIITIRPLSRIEKAIFNLQISDHKAVCRTLHTYKQHKPKATFKYRDFKNIG